MTRPSSTTIHPTIDRILLSCRASSNTQQYFRANLKNIFSVELQIMMIEFINLQANISADF